MNDQQTLDNLVIVLQTIVQRLEIIEKKLSPHKTRTGGVKAKQPAHTMERLIQYVFQCHRYIDDRQFTPAIKLGYMPRGKLLKLMKLPAAEFESLAEKAVESGEIKTADIFLDGVLYKCCYVPAGKHVDPAIDASKIPAKLKWLCK